MGKIKEIMSKNSYLVPKIAGGVVAVSAAVLTVVLIVSSGDDETADGKLTGSKVAEVSAHSSKDIGETDETEELTTSNNDIVGTDESQSDTGDSTTDESTEATETTVIAMGGNNGGGNQSSGDTLGTTTPTKPSNSSGGQSGTTGTTAPTAATTAPTTALSATTQPTTAAPVVNKRGANGVILETLTVYYTSGETYTIPDTWQELATKLDSEENELNISFKHISISNLCKQDVFSNDILIYSTKNGEGSTKEDIIEIYGTPMYQGTDEEIGANAIYYKYIDSSISDEDALYIRFDFSANMTNNKLGSVVVSKLANFLDDTYLN